MKIADFEIGRSPFLIAECSINHCGDLARAMQMISVAKDAGCSAVKFQTYKTDEFCRSDDPMFQVFKQCELKDSAWSVLSEYCRRRGIIFLSTPQNPSDLARLLPVGMPAIKVGSDDLCNLPLLREYASHGLPMLLSTGMSTLEEMAVAGTEVVNVPVIWMVCTSQYPTPPEEANLLRTRQVMLPVGFSDHTNCASDTASIMAVALGACAFERHFTLDHDLPGPEHSWVCEPQDLRRWVKSVNEAWQMRGTGSFELSEREKEQKRKYQRKSGALIRGAA